MLAGIGSIILNLFGYEFSMLMWIDNWGENTGWMIRGGAIMVGAVLFFIGMRGEGEEGEPQTEQM